MKREFLTLKPKRYLCPYCGEWHDWQMSHPLSWHNSAADAASHVCDKIPFSYDDRSYQLHFKDDYCYYFTESWCLKALFNLSGRIEISAIEESFDQPIVTFKVPFKATNALGSEFCCSWGSKSICNLMKLGDQGDHQNMEITLGFEFEKAAYDRIIMPALLEQKKAELNEREAALEFKEQELTELECDLAVKENELAEREAELTAQQEIINDKTKNKEETPMAKATPTTTQKTSLKDWYLDTTPRQKGQQAMAIIDKHKDVLKWTLPIAAIYTAYKILDDPNSGITVENADELFQETFGEQSEFLANKAKMRKLVKRGSAIALGYTGAKLASNFVKPTTATTVEDLETSIDDGINKISKSEKLITSLAPNASDIVPAAVSVIILFAMVNPMKLTFLDTAKDKLSNLPKFITGFLEDAVEWGKDMLVEHFDIDVESPEFKKNSKKILILAAIAAVAVFVYGKNMLAKKEVSEEEKADSKLKKFMDYLMNLFNKIAPTAFAAVTTVLLTSKALDSKPATKDDVVEGEAVVVEEATDNEEFEAEEVLDDTEDDENFEEVDDDPEDAE